MTASRAHPPAGPLALTGMRAAGKSSVGRLLARHLERPFVDLDEETLRWAGRVGRGAMDVGALLEREGVLAFRELEAQALRRLLEGGVRVVLATGGGAVERADNRAWLRRSALTVWLNVPVPVLRERLARDATRRPALLGRDSVEEVAAVLAARESWYRETADLLCSAAGAPEALALEIVARLDEDSPRTRSHPNAGQQDVPSPGVNR